MFGKVILRSPLVVGQVRQGSDRIPLSNEPGIVTTRVREVMVNQTDDVNVDGLWVHYSAKQW